ncbi:MAG: dihydroorotate dehydrogenase [Deltaproteobacteria bacterium HGW-Deltaproteobacteria-14]|nr:MAG: dihydroorotate dehydrogenase [Deltaproteobacteria bacterium HGW-Deltaproteobacteria-14]
MDLTTRYLGLTLESPIVCSSSPMMQEIDNLRRMEDAGASAVVLHSLFEEQITLESQDLDRNLFHGTESYAEALSYFPEMESFEIGPEAYLEHVRKAKEALSIPVVASLNGISTGGWVDWARRIEAAGADAIELNTYFMPTDIEVSGSQLEEMYLELVRDVKGSVKIPVAVKLSPFFSSIPNFCASLDALGVDGLVMFNRFYQPDFDLERLEVVPRLTLSSPSELLMRLHWVAVLAGRIKADMAVTGGVHGATDVIKSMMAGAKVAMMTSALLEHGIDHLRTVRHELEQWLEANEYPSIALMQGSLSQRKVAEPAAFERANYMKVLRSGAWSRA